MRKKNKKLVGASAFAITLALSNVAVSAVATPVAYAAEAAQGKWGDCNWEINTNGALRVSKGTAATPQASVLDTTYDAKGNLVQDWRVRSISPWRNYASQITAVRFESNVILPADCSHLFEGFSSLKTVQIEDADASQVRNMAGMFEGCSALESINLSKLNVQGITDMSSMFKGCTNLKTVNLTNWQTQNVTNMSGMFEGCSALENLVLKDDKDLSQWNTSSVTNMTAMFKGCTSLRNLDLTDGYWNTDKITADTSKNMFADCTLNKFIVSTDYTIASVNMIPISTVSDGMWWSDNDQRLIKNTDIYEKHNGKKISDTYTAAVPILKDSDNVLHGLWGSCTWELRGDGTLEVGYGTGEPAPAPTQQYPEGLSFWDYYDKNVRPIKKIIFDEGVILPENSSNLFSSLTSLETVELADAETKNVKNMSNMFYGCTSLTTINTGNWNTGRVENMRGMFRNCTSLTSLDLSHFNTTALQDMALIFRGCTKLQTLNLNNWNTKRVSVIPVPYIDGNRELSGYASFFGCDSLESITVGADYDMKNSPEMFPNGDQNGTWFSKTDGKRYAQTDIVSKRSKIADTYTKTSEEKTVAPFITDDCTMTLESMLKLNFFADLSSVPADQLESVNMVFNIANGTPVTVPYKDSTPDGNTGIRRFGCPLNSLQVGDKVTATLNWNGGSVTAEPYSLADFMADHEEQYGKDSGQTLLNNLVHATQDYSHYAQAYLPNAGAHAVMPYHAEITKAMQNEAKSAVDSYKFSGDNMKLPNNNWNAEMTLALESGIDLNVKFTLPSGVSYQSATIDGKACDAYAEGDKWVVTIPSIEAFDLSKIHTITLTAGGQTATVKVAALTWVREALNTSTYAPGTAGGACAASIYRYSQAAEAYAASTK